MESYAEKEVTNNKNVIPDNWLSNWSPNPKSFDKFSKYFDTDKYEGDYLGDSANWPQDLGKSPPASVARAMPAIYTTVPIYNNRIHPVNPVSVPLYLCASVPLCFCTSV